MVCELLEKVKQTTERQSCEACGIPALPAAVCSDCSIWLCAICKQSHENIPATSGHEVVKIEDIAKDAAAILVPKRSQRCGRSGGRSSEQSSCVAELDEEISLGMAAYFTNKIYSFCESLVFKGKK